MGPNISTASADASSNSSFRASPTVIEASDTPADSAAARAWEMCRSTGSTRWTG